MRRVRAVLPAVLAAMTTVSPAHATGPADLPAALASHVPQVAAAAITEALANTTATDGLVCAVEGAGSYERPYVGGIVYSQDRAVGSISCVSSDPSASYNVGVEVHLQIFDGSKWQWGAWCGVGGLSAAGAAAAVGTCAQNYSPGHPWLHRFHRGWIVARTTTGRVYSFPTTDIWYVPA